MNFILDMGIAPNTAKFLNRLSHDAIHLCDLNLERMEDEDIIKKARSESRVILTHDLDFGRIIALSKESLPSTITFRLQDMRSANVNLFIAIVVERYEKELISGALVSVSEESIRIRTLPV